MERNENNKKPNTSSNSEKGSTQSRSAEQKAGQHKQSGTAHKNDNDQEPGNDNKRSSSKK